MLDPRIYRAALVPVLLALIVRAPSRSRTGRGPSATTLAPDAFDGAAARCATLDEPRRPLPGPPPGRRRRRARSPARVADALRALRASTCARATRSTGETIDGEQRRCTTVIAERPGTLGPADRRRRPPRRRRAPAPRPSCRAPRRCSSSRACSARRGDAAHAHVRLDERRQRRRGGRARRCARGSARPGRRGARARRPRRRGDAPAVRRRAGPTSRASAPLRLRAHGRGRRVRAETGVDPGAPRALDAVARLARPADAHRAGPARRAGLPAVLLSASASAAPPPGAAVSRARLRRSAARRCARSARSTTGRRRAGAAPRATLVVQRKVAARRGRCGCSSARCCSPALVVAVDGSRACAAAASRSRRGCAGSPPRPRRSLLAPPRSRACSGSTGLLVDAPPARRSRRGR